MRWTLNIRSLDGVKLCLGTPLSGSSPLSGLVAWFAEEIGCQGRRRFAGPKVPLTANLLRDTRRLGRIPG